MMNQIRPSKYKQKFIVAEITKNWRNGEPLTDGVLLQSKFEKVIEVNDGRGYCLLTFALDQLITGPGCMMETIIAVFQDKEQP